MTKIPVARKEPVPPKQEVVFVENITGFYTLNGPFTTFDNPFDYTATSQFDRSTSASPVVVVTGKAYKVNGYTIAVQILMTKNERTLIKWTHWHNLKRV